MLWGSTSCYSYLSQAFWTIALPQCFIYLLPFIFCLQRFTNIYIYTEPKKKLSPSLNVDLFVQFWILFETRFLHWINVLGFYMVISWPILQATSCIYVCTSKGYHSTTGSYFAKVSFLVQYILFAFLTLCVVWTFIFIL